MNPPPSEALPRILIVDDNPAIHEDFRKILGAKSDAQSRLENVEAALFGEGASLMERAGFRHRLRLPRQGGPRTRLQKAIEDGDPYVMAFVDVRMPPGWDGIETVEPRVAVLPGTASRYLHRILRLFLGRYDAPPRAHRQPVDPQETLRNGGGAPARARPGTQMDSCPAGQAADGRPRPDGAAAHRGVVVANQSLQQEIEERIRVQDALRTSEERFSKAFRSSPFPMAIQSAADRRFLDANPSFLELSGFSAEDLCQANFRKSSSGPRTASHDRTLSRPKAGYETIPAFSDAGMEPPARPCSHPNPSPSETRPACFSSSKTSPTRLKLEAQLRQAQKMEVIGRMAAGIAHEFNNILTVIQGDVGLLQSVNSSGSTREPCWIKSCRPANAPPRSPNNSSPSAANRCSNRTPRPVRRRPAQKKMLERLIGEKFEIHLACQNELPSVLADEGGMEQILINLALNARDAMPNGGVIDIATDACILTEADASPNPEARAGRFVRLSVTDHGCGMNPQVLARIFDPFFTTKDVGKGTGLGLSTIHGIVKQHEGWIEVSSETRPRLHLHHFPPRIQCRRRRAVPKPSRDDDQAEPGRGETILVVEDENIVRELACVSLERRGL